MLNKIINWWKNSKLLYLIDKAENKYFKNKLTNTDFTILCPNCIGGLIYHRLGEKFNSPTINISIDTPDFCNFLDNLDYYISQDLTETLPKENGIPVGIVKGNGKDIPDIQINFIHYKTFEEGRKKWNERKTRINKANTYVIMYDIDDINESDYTKVGFAEEKDLIKFESFECNNKVLLTSNPNNTKDYALYIKPNYKGANPLVCLNRDVLGLNVFEKHFDFVSFLNKK